MKTLASISFAVALALSTAGCVNREAQAQGKRTEELIKDPTVSVTVQPVSVRTLSETLEITGELATSSDTTVGSNSAGRLVSVSIQDGSTVTAGQVVAQLDSTLQRSQVQQAQQQVNGSRAALNQALTNARVAPQRSSAAVATAEAQLRSAKSQLSKARSGARSEEVSQAQAQVSAAKSSMETARRDRDRARTLFEQGAVSQQRVDAAENAYQAAMSNYEAALENLRMKQNWTRPEDLSAAEEAVRQAEEGLRSAQAQKSLDALLKDQVDQARANLKSAEAALSIAQQSLADTQIRAPFSGRVFGKPAQPGSVLNPGSPVFRLVGKEGLYFEGSVAEKNVGQLNQGDTVEVTLDALGPDKIAGHIVSVSATSQEVARVFRVRIAIDGAPAAAKPGMFAHGVVSLKTIEGATVVPSSAVVSEGSDSFVFAAEGGVAKKVKVTLGLKTDGVIQVIGVPSGTQVVVEGVVGLEEGKKLKVQEPGKKEAKGDAPSLP